MCLRSTECLHRLFAKESVVAAPTVVAAGAAPGHEPLAAFAHVETWQKPPCLRTKVIAT